MFTPPSTHRRGRTATVTLLLAAALIGATGGAAAADPPVDRDSCVLALARVGTWPGSMSYDGNEIRLVSDAFVSYRSAHGGCTPDPASR